MSDSGGISPATTYVMACLRTAWDGYAHEQLAHLSMTMPAVDVVHTTFVAGFLSGLSAYRAASPAATTTLDALDDEALMAAATAEFLRFITAGEAAVVENLTHSPPTE